MQVEWTSYNSPIGPLTVVECEAGPLAVEFPHRAMTIKWAVRLRAAVPRPGCFRGRERAHHRALLGTRGYRRFLGDAR